MTADPLTPFHPLVARWFRERVGEPSPPQREAWPVIAKGGHTLVLAPTGTGKTLAAFLWEINALITEGARAPLANGVHILYISPLKALNNDVQKNLELPLAQIAAAFHAAGEAFPRIRVAVRTGDTPQAARRRMVRETPHILITTPESLHLLLMSEGGRSMFSSLRTVIVDEIHAVAGTKRGAHLALTLERLDAVAPGHPQRIGLSATQKPLEEIGRFLGGVEARSDAEPIRHRPVAIVDCGLVKTMETAVVSPVDDLAHVDGSVWPAVYALVKERILGAATTLVFVNNRAQAEKIASRVNAIAGEEIALPYHGSLSRERRLLLEGRLKAGELRALVATSSLELGIDIGSVDLVIQLQSPKRVSAGLQRVGRAGHRLDAVSRGLFMPTFRDDALEQLAIVQAMATGDVEPTRVVRNPLDVLAQLLVAMVAIEEDEWTGASLFSVVRQAYPFHDLPRASFDETLAMLSGKYPAEVAAELELRLYWNRQDDTLLPARGSRGLAIMSGGTIPDRGLYTVYLADKTRLGELDEEFVHESRVGDAFQLGSSTWRIKAIEHDRVLVLPAAGAPARMPFWHGDFMARSSHLAPRIGTLRRALGAASDDLAIQALAVEYHADVATVQSLATYVRAQQEITGRVPDDRQLVLEEFRDEVGSVRLVLHTPFGGRVNAPWGMALGRRMRDRLGIDVQVQTTDDGIMLRCPQLAGDAPIDIIRSLTPEEGKQLLLEELGGSSLFGARFRMNAARALLLPRGNPRRRMPLWLQRLKSADLLEHVRELPSFPLIVETYREVLQDAFDLEGLTAVLGRTSTGALPMHSVRTQSPSPFAQSLQLGFVMDWMYGDDTPRAEARVAMLSLDRSMLDELLGGEGADEATRDMLEVVLNERRGVVTGFQARDVDELLVLVDRAGDLTDDALRLRVAPSGEWNSGDPCVEAEDRGRLLRVSIGGESRWILADRADLYASAATDVDARREILSRWVSLASPFTLEEATHRFGFPEAEVRAAVEGWQARGRLVRGYFGDRGTTRWVSARWLERARRRELNEARAQVQPVPLTAFAAFLQRWQHLASGTQRTGRDATRDTVQQLLGLPRPGLAWEREYLPARAAGFAADDLDRVAQQDRLVWIAERPRLTQAGVVVRFVRRGEARLWVTPMVDAMWSEAATAVRDALREHGASYTDDLATLTGIGGHRLYDALRELVVDGVLTNDTTSALRDVLRWRRAAPDVDKQVREAGTWLPDTFVVQRRVNVRRLGRWQRPDRPDAPTWSGRWSLVQVTSVMGRASDDGPTDAEQVARQWLARYGVVSREWWRRERPALEWRAVYRELRRLEYQGIVRRGHFITGIAGEQFALPEAVEMLREEASATPVVMVASDPANVWTLPLAVDAQDAFARPRGTGAYLVTSVGQVVLVAESGGRKVRIREGTERALVRLSLDALVVHLLRVAMDRRRDLVVEVIDGEPAVASPWAPVFLETGFQRTPGGLRHRAASR